ncbi:YdcF family protein [Chryseobacterium sp. CT-SW4]|uniref:YdcF family protein n=1 Tax=Chryseobacterium sp. SW-1 TaxID=3157343 RepID=UPI003B01534F
MLKIFLQIFKYTVFFITGWFLIHSLYIINDGLTDTLQKADIAVIPGNKVNEDGSLSKRLEARLNTAFELYKHQRVKKIIVSGGLGKEGFYEGDIMKDYLLYKGVPDSLIIVDNYGNNTQATVDHTLAMRKDLGFNSIIVVSQYFHVSRTKKLFKERGFSNVSSVSPHYFEIRDLYSIIREFPAYYIQ